MNYRTLAKAALALSLGLIVASASAVTTTYTDTPLYGATFESATSAVEPLNDHAYVTNTLVTTYTGSEGGATYGWLGGASDESKIIAANGGQALQLNTDSGTLTNKLAPTAVATPFNAGIAASGSYIETEAKFVASDILDPGVRGGTDDSKFAIYAYCDEDAGGPTNLVVYHKYMVNGVPGYTNEIFGAVNCNVYTKLRVEMKQIADPTTFEQVNVFSVTVGDGPALTSPLAIDGCWFLTVENDENDDNKLVSTINFKGTGEVDNLEVGTFTTSTTYAVDWTASQNVIASNLTDTVELAAGETNFANNVQLAFYPAEGNVITNVNGITQSPALDVFTYTVNSADAIVTVLAGVAPYFPRTATAGQDGSAEHPFEIADVDDIQALKDAFAADASWRSKNYKLVADIDATALGYWDGIGTASGTNNDTGLCGGTLDGDGHTISNLKFSTAKYRGFFNQMSNHATIKNLTINVVDIQETSAAEHGYAAFVGNLKGSVLENCVATGTIGTVAKPAMHSSAGFAVKVADGGVGVFVNCTNKIDIVCSLNDNPKVGGIAGLFEGGVLTNCYNEGDITITCKKCKNTGNGAGGLIGYAQTNPIMIYHCGNAGTVQSTDTTPNGVDGNGKSFDIKVGTIIAMQNSAVATIITGDTIAQADKVPAGASANISGLNFATVSGNVATFVADNALASNNTYKVMLDGATATYPFAAPGTISFDTTMYTPTYAITVAEGLDLTNDAGSPVITFTATAATPTYAVDWTGSENVDVAVDGDFWDGGTAGNFTNNTVVTFTPYSSLMITNVNGEAVGPISEFSLTVTEATNIVVLAGVAQPIGRIKPLWAAHADTTKFWNWVDDNHVSDYASVDYTTEYLLNTAVGQDPAPEIKITSITVGATTTTIEVRGTVGRGLVDFANLNGVLNVAVGNSVTSLTPKAIPAANLDTSVEGVATITIPNADGCFFRARVDFETPQASLTAVSE